MHYEVIFEDGSHAIANYLDDDEAKLALTAHHERAKNGESAKPMSTPRNDLGETPVFDPDRAAVRIVKALVYDNHPADYGVGREVATADLKSKVATSLSSLESDGTVNLEELAQQIRALSSPLIAERKSRHDSSYVMVESRELDWSGDN